MRASQSRETYLQSILEQFVHLCHLGWHTKVDSSVTDLNDETASNIRVDLITFRLPNLIERVCGVHTLGTTLSLLPCPTYWDFATALSNRLRVLLSRGCTTGQQAAPPGPTTNPDKSQKPTAALVTTSSTSPLAALIRTPNFSLTDSKTPNRLLSASVLRKFLTTSPLSAEPVCFCSSAMICLLSSADSVGAISTSFSFASLLNTLARFSIALAVGSSAAVFAAAVYCR